MKENNTNIPSHTKEFLKLLDLFPQKELVDYSIEELRQGYMKTVEGFGSPLTPVYHVEDIKIDSTHNSFPINTRFYKPAENIDTVWIYVHGGGWCRGGVEVYDTHLREMANCLGIGILSVEYRMAPEHLFPAASQDVFDVYMWIEKDFINSHQIKKVYLGGDSAGGNITAGVVCQLIEENIKLPDAYIGFYPALDFSGKQESYNTFANGYLLTKESVKFYIDQYIQKDEDKYNFLASPILYPHLEKFPKTLILTAELDPLVDEQNEFIERLKLCGVDVEQKIVPGVIHPFMMLGRVFPEVYTSIAWLKNKI